jgi:hypothetical protein
MEYNPVYWHSQKQVLQRVVEAIELQTSDEVTTALPGVLRQLGVGAQLQGATAIEKERRAARGALPPSSPLSPWMSRLGGFSSGATPTSLAVRQAIYAAARRDRSGAAGGATPNAAARQGGARRSGGEGSPPSAAASSAGGAEGSSRAGSWGRGGTLDEIALRWGIAAEAAEASESCRVAAVAEREAMAQILSTVSPSGKKKKKMTRKGAAEQRRLAAVAAREHGARVRAERAKLRNVRDGGRAPPWVAWSERHAAQQAGTRPLGDAARREGASASGAAAGSASDGGGGSVADTTGATAARYTPPRFDRLGTARRAQAALETAIVWQVNQLSHLMGHPLARARTRAEIGTILRAAAYAAGYDDQVAAIEDAMLAEQDSAAGGRCARGGARALGPGVGGTRGKARGGRGDKRKARGANLRTLEQLALDLPDDVVVTAAEIVAVQAQLSAMAIDDAHAASSHSTRRSEAMKARAAAADGGGAAAAALAAADHDEGASLPAHTTVPLLLSSRTLLNAMLSMEGAAPEVHAPSASAKASALMVDPNRKARAGNTPLKRAVSAAEAAGLTRGTLRVALRVRDERWQLMRRFASMHPRYRQYGFDDSSHADRRRDAKRVAERRKREVLSAGSGAGRGAPKKRASTIAFGRHVPVKAAVEVREKGEGVSVASVEVRMPPTGDLDARKLLSSAQTSEISLRQREAAMESAMNRRDLKSVRLLARHGIAKSQRRRAWSVLLQLPKEREQKARLRALEANARSLELLTDRIAAAEVRLIVDSPVYFPFGDAYARVATAFFRDPQVAALCIEAMHPPLLLCKPLGTSASGAKQYAKACDVSGAFARGGAGGATGAASSGGASGGNAGLHMPPGGVLPFHGFAFYIAPLAFITESTSTMLAIFRAMFCRYWCRLNVVRSTPGSLLSICALFERLLKRNEGEVWRHLLHLDCPPLDIALPWIRYAFAGFGCLRKPVGGSTNSDVLVTAANAPDPSVAGIAGRPLHPEMNRRWGAFGKHDLRVLAAVDSSLALPVNQVRPAGSGSARAVALPCITAPRRAHAVTDASTPPVLCPLPPCASRPPPRRRCSSCGTASWRTTTSPCSGSSPQRSSRTAGSSFCARRRGRKSWTA